MDIKTSFLSKVCTTIAIKLVRDISQIMKHSSEVKKRAERIRNLRIKTKLSRAEFCRRYKFSVPTLKSWEYGEVQTMQSSGINRFVRGLNKEGVPCTMDYLLNGGVEPTQIVVSVDFKDEIKQYRQTHATAVNFVVEDDHWQPYLRRNTLVLGFPVDLLQPNQFINRLCIVNYKSGATNVCILNPTTQANNFIVTSTLSANATPELLQVDDCVLIAPIRRIIFSD